MAERYVDSVSGSNGDNGTTQALAWATIEYALESGALSAGDNVWVRRGHSEIPVSDIAPIYDGTAGSPISVIGWPRAAIPNTTITEATWTNGSTTVDLVVGVTLARTSHQGRFATAPDGEKYLITRIVDSNALIIDREYVGATVSGTSGLFAIDEDEDYSTRPTDVDGWDSDADTLALIDFNSTAYQLNLNSDNAHIFKNLEIKDSTDVTGIVRTDGTTNVFSMIGCLLKQSNNTEIFNFVIAYCHLERVIMEGSGAGTSQMGIDNGRHVFLKDCAIYNMGDSGIRVGGEYRLENVNIGVEQANGDDDIFMDQTWSVAGHIHGRDVKLGGTNGYVFLATTANKGNKCGFENYQKVLGDHKTWFAGGEYTNVDVGDTNAPSVASAAGSTTDLIEILPNVSGYEFIEDWAVAMFVHEFEVDATSRTYTYYIQNNLGVTINAAAKDDIWLKAEYVKVRDDDTEYIIGEVFSGETSIADRADDTDWDSLSVTVQPAVASKVRITCYHSKYVASGGIYIDPKPAIS